MVIWVPVFKRTGTSKSPIVVVILCLVGSSSDTEILLFFSVFFSSFSAQLFPSLKDSLGSCAL